MRGGKETNLETQLKLLTNFVFRSVPRVSYVTCLDMWMVSCIVFVFVELVEFSSIFLLNGITQSKLINVIDKAALILLPCGFVAFNILYWPYLLNPQ